MADHDYINFYTPFEYESYQQYQQYPSEDEQMSTTENILNLFIQQSMINMQNTNQRLEKLSSHLEILQVQIDFQQYQQHPFEDEQMSTMESTLNMFIQQSMINMQNTNQRLEKLSSQLEILQVQLNFLPRIMDVQTNNQFTLEFGEVDEEDVDETKEEIMFEGCGIMKIEKEIEIPHEDEVPQERSYSEEAETVDNEEVMAVEKKERLLNQEEIYENNWVKVSKADIDRVIDHICSLFSKQRLGRIWTPHHLYFKFMEFLPKQRNTKEDVLSVSFWPP